MSEEEYKEQLVQCWMLAKMSTTLDTGKMLAMISNAETVGPLLDPTAWIAKNRDMHEDKEIIQAVNALRLTHERIAKACAERSAKEARSAPKVG